MPRKKATQTDLDSTTTPETKVSPKARGTKKAALAATNEADNATRAKATKAKTRTPVEVVKPSPRTKKVEEQAAETVAAVAAITDAPETPSASKRSRTRKAPADVTPERDTADAVEAIGKAASKSPAGKRATAKPKPVKPSESSKQADLFVEHGQANALPVDDLPIPSWRPRSSPSKAEASETSQPVRDKRQRGRGRSAKPDTAIEITAIGAVEVKASPGAKETPFEHDLQHEIPITFRPREAAKRPAAGDPLQTKTNAAESDVSVTFRSRGGDAAAINAEESRADRKPRRGRERKPVEEPAEAKAPVEVKKPEPPKAPVKPIIPTPEEAPQVVLRDGVPTLVRNHRVYPPIMFFGSSSNEKRAQTVLEELKMAAEAGVHIHSHLVEFEVNPGAVDDNVAVAAYLLKRSVEIDPEAQIIFRLVFQAPKNWQQDFPNAKYNLESGGVAEPSVCDNAFWGVAADCLKLLAKKLRLLDLREHILGVHLERGEWFLADNWGYDDSLAAKLQFRDWARQRYSNDEVALRASWFDGEIKFENIQVPRYMPEGSEGDKFVRSSRKQRKYVDYHLFLSDATVNRIIDLAYAVKEASDGHFVIGVSYGYTFEWSHPSSGHLSLGKLLRAPEIDIIAGPPSYRNREPGGTSPFPGPIDSCALNGKLFISEEDFKTSLSGGHEPDDFNPVIKTPQALENIHWRGAGAALTHGSGIAWMDLWGNGWLKTPSIWERGKMIANALIERMGQPLGDPEVVIFIDERALAYLVDQNAFRMLVQDVREAVLRAGVNAGFYLLSDLAHREKFPEAKLYLFLNAWDIRPDLRSAIKTRLQRDNKVLFWLYSAGLFDAGRESLERAREVTGIALKPQPFHSKSGTTILARRHPLTAPLTDRHLGGHAQLEPSYFAIPEEATVLGEYSQTGLPSFVVRDFTTEGEPDLNWSSVFLGEPEVTPALIRALAQMAGAHVYNFQEDLVHVRPPFLTVHCKGTGQRAIALPNKWSAYDIVNETWIGLDQTMLRFTGIDGTTHPFLVGPREELQHLLNLDPKDLLHIETLPKKQENQLREDSLAFDVPIMKLNEWMESSDSDEVAEDWFLKPQQVLDEPEGESEKVGRRRGRRGRRTRGGSEETSDARREPSSMTGQEFDADAGMSFMFRKRT